MTGIGWIDDATGKVPSARFQAEHEDSAGYLQTLRHRVETRGIPWSVYRDQHGAFQRNDDHWSIAEQLAGRQLHNQVGRAREEPGIESIAARSAQAKGRVERLWNGVMDSFLAAYNQRSPNGRGKARRRGESLTGDLIRTTSSVCATNEPWVKNI